MAPEPHVLVSWDDDEARSELQRLELALDALSDDAHIAELGRRHGAGRNDIPVTAMWLAVIAGNVSRFLKVPVEIEKEQGLVSATVDDFRAALMTEIPDVGLHLGHDGKAVESHSTGVHGRESGRMLRSGRRLGGTRDLGSRQDRQSLRVAPRGCDRVVDPALSLASRLSVSATIPGSRRSNDENPCGDPKGIPFLHPLHGRRCRGRAEPDRWRVTLTGHFRMSLTHELSRT